MTRREAIAAGVKYFSTGKPCKYGHTSERYIGNGACLECIRPKQTALAVIDKPGEIMPATVDAAARLEIKKRALDIQEARLALRTQSVAVVIQTRLQDRAERLERRARAAIVKSRLVDVYVLIDPTDYEIVTAMVWAYAVQREPLLRLEDVVTGREMKDSRFVLRCYPENKAEILKLTSEMFAKHTAAGNAEAVSAVIDLAQRQLAASAEAEGEWPEESAR